MDSIDNHPALISTLARTGVRHCAACSVKIIAGKHLKKNEVEAIMVLCPKCKSDLDVEEEELEEGEILSCTECGTDFEVAGVEPLELTKISEDEDADEEEE